MERVSGPPPAATVPRPLFSLNGRTNLLDEAVLRLPPLIAPERIFLSWSPRRFAQDRVIGHLRPADQREPSRRPIQTITGLPRRIHFAFQVVGGSE
jgi:hypothetical protein